ncbi:MAG: hypothetical protein Q4B42_03600 [Oscillospiraceae bacterium]|nr:hypothetical protein [Oscillospiraceae bacterium]
MKTVNEWTAVGVLVTLTGLFFALYMPLEARNRRQAEQRLELERRLSCERSESEKELRELREEQKRALIENTEATTRLNATIGHLADSFAELKNSNADSHRRLWNKCSELEGELAGHETRLSVLENERGK